MRLRRGAVAKGCIGSIPSLLHLHAEVSLGKMLNPGLPLIEKVLHIYALNECMCEWVNGKTVL